MSVLFVWFGELWPYSAKCAEARQPLVQITDASKVVMLHLVSCMVLEMCNVSFWCSSGLRFKRISHITIPASSIYMAFLQDKYVKYKAYDFYPNRLGAFITEAIPPKQTEI